MNVLSLLPWVLPPLLGAVIGYVTNALAIKMLFRPLTEKRVLGMRVPLTPGIIPRRRYQLSESIARMVSTRLLTEEVLVEKIRSPEFQTSLKRSVENLTTDLLSGHHRPSPDADVSPAAGEPARFAVVVEDLLSAFLSSAAFRTTAISVTGRLTAGALELSAGQVLPNEERIRSVVDHLSQAVSSPNARAAAGSAVSGWIEGHVRRNTPVRDLLGRPIVAGVLVALPRLYEPVTQTILEYLKLPRTRAELSVHGRELLQRVLKRLNLFQRLLVSATQYQKNLNDNMPGIIDDLISSLEHAAGSRRNREHLIRAARRTVLRWMNTGAGDLISLLGVNPAESIPRLVDVAAGMISRTEVRVQLQEFAVRTTGAWRDRPVGDLLESLIGVGRTELVGFVEQTVENWTADSRRMASLSAGLRSLLQQLSAEGSPASPGRLIPLTEHQKEALDSWLTGVAAVQIERRVPELLHGIDVHTMVVNKIDALDVKSVEDLLLMVIARHLKWINLFGAVLGALIGALQILLNVVT